MEFGVGFGVWGLGFSVWGLEFSVGDLGRFGVSVQQGHPVATFAAMFWAQRYPENPIPLNEGIYLKS